MLGASLISHFQEILIASLIFTQIFSFINRGIKFNECHFISQQLLLKTPSAQYLNSASGIWLPDLIITDDYRYFHGKNSEQGAPYTSFCCCCYIEMQTGQPHRLRFQGVFILLSNMLGELKLSF
jgi:hypothetical protein